MNKDTTGGPHIASASPAFLTNFDSTFDTDQERTGSNDYFWNIWFFDVMIISGIFADTI